MGTVYELATGKKVEPPNPYKFSLEEIVNVGQVRCKIVKIEMYDGAPDYLCLALNPQEIVYGNDLPGSSWVREEYISR